MSIRVLRREHLTELLDMPSAIEAMRSAFAGLSTGTARVPVRTPVEAVGATLLTMPGYLPDPGTLGLKAVTVAPDNAESGLPAIHALVILLDPVTGSPLALLEGGWLTALRTGAATGLATDLLARPDARVLAVIGAGAQAPTQIEAVRSVRPLEEVRIVSRSGISAEVLADSLEGVRAHAMADAGAAVAGADVVVTVTDSRTPVLPAGAVGGGTLVSAVGGYRPDMQELPTDLVAGARVVVDQVEAALEEAGDIVIPVREGRLDVSTLVELGRIVTGEAPGRTDPSELTVFKSVGSAAQDLAVAAVALARAEERGVGERLEL